MIRIPFAFLSLLLVAAPAVAQTLRIPPAIQTQNRVGRCRHAIGTRQHPARPAPASRAGFSREAHRRARRRTTAALKFDDVRTGVGVTGVVGILKGGGRGRSWPFAPTWMRCRSRSSSTCRTSRPCPTSSTRADTMRTWPSRSAWPSIFGRHARRDSGYGHVLLSARRGRRSRWRPHGRAPHAGRWAVAVRARRRCSACTCMPTIEVGHIGYNVGGAMAASDRFTVTITGKKTHGAYPHTGIDPLPIAAQVVMAFQTIVSRQRNAVEPTVVSVGSITRRQSLQHPGRQRADGRDGPDAHEGRSSVGQGAHGRHPQGRSRRPTARRYDLVYNEGAPVTFNDPASPTRRCPRWHRSSAGSASSPRRRRWARRTSRTTSRRCRGSSSSWASAIRAKKITAMVHTEYFDIDEDALPIGVRAMSTVVARLLVQEVTRRGLPGVVASREHRRRRASRERHAPSKRACRAWGERPDAGAAGPPR